MIIHTFHPVSSLHFTSHYFISLYNMWGAEEICMWNFGGRGNLMARDQLEKPGVNREIQ
jgi:hypothetical protein